MLLQCVRYILTYSKQLSTFTLASCQHPVSRFNAKKQRYASCKHMSFVTEKNCWNPHTTIICSWLISSEAGCLDVGVNINIDSDKVRQIQMIDIMKKVCREFPKLPQDICLQIAPEFIFYAGILRLSINWKSIKKRVFTFWFNTRENALILLI